MVYILNITQICIGTGALICAVETMPTMLYGLDMLYPEPIINNTNNEITKFKHIYPYMMSSIVGILLIGMGMNNIIRDIKP
jgi:hypothetical protein